MQYCALQIVVSPSNFGFSNLIDNKVILAKTKKLPAKDRNQFQPKGVRDHFRAWNFQYAVQTYLLGEEGFVLLKRTEHLRTRLGHNRPQAVSSVTAFCNFSLVLVPSPEMGPLISVLIVGFVQSQNRTVHTMIPWLQDAKWTSGERR